MIKSHEPGSVVISAGVRPRGIKGSKGEGHRFEAHVERCVRKLEGEVIPLPWIHFRDSEGSHIAQPDILLVDANAVLVIECKRTMHEGALSQLSDLYLPLAQALWPTHNCGGLVVGKNCAHGWSTDFSTIYDAWKDLHHRQWRRPGVLLFNRNLENLNEPE